MILCDTGPLAALIDGRFISYTLCRGAEHASGRAALDHLAVPGGSDVPVVAGEWFSGAGRVMGLSGG